MNNPLYSGSRNEWTASAEALEEQHIRVKRCRHGLFMYNINDRYIGRSLDFYGEYSEGEARLFCQFLKPGMTVLDIGANMGVHTVVMAQAVGPQGLVVAYEPQRVVYQMLCGNVALNALENVSTVMAGMGGEIGTMRVPRVDYRRVRNFGGIALSTSDKGESVPVMTLDSLDLQRCDFVKIDVEGMEQSVLEGGRATLARCQPVLYVENDRRRLAASLIAGMNEAGYRTYCHWPPLFNPLNFFGEQTNIFEGLLSYNIVGIARTHQFTMNGFREVTPETAADDLPVED